MSAQNKFMTALIVLNMLLILVVIYLLNRNEVPSQISSQEPSLTQPTNETTATDPVAVNAAVATTHVTDTVPSVEKSNSTVDANKVASEIVNSISGDEPIKNEIVKAGEPDSTNAVNVYYDGGLVRKEEIDSEGNQLITISKSLEDIGELSSSDANYVKALEELKQGTRFQITIRKTKAKEASQYKANQVSEEQSIDYFNKIDVSKKDMQPATDNLTLAGQIAKIVSEPEGTTEVESTFFEETEDRYMQTLKTESIERANEMRTIQVVKGDTLSKIAKRAYGSAYKYQRIFEANPHLTDPDKIVVGDTLRVPL